MYGLLAVIFFVGFVIARRIVASPFGHVLTAIRDNPMRAMAVGHDIQLYKLTRLRHRRRLCRARRRAQGTLQSYMSPEAFTFETSGQLVMQTVIGGAGTLLGPLVGGALWLYLRNELQSALGLGAAGSWSSASSSCSWSCFLRRGIVGGFADLCAPAAAGAPTSLRPPNRRCASASRADSCGRRRIGRQRSPSRRGASASATAASSPTRTSISVNEGEIRGLIGPNGAGKSTFFKMLTGEMPPSSGKIFMFGGETSPGSTSPPCARSGIAKSYQINQLFSKLTVRREPDDLGAVADPRPLPASTCCATSTIWTSSTPTSTRRCACST